LHLLQVVGAGPSCFESIHDSLRAMKAPTSGRG